MFVTVNLTGHDFTENNKILLFYLKSKSGLVCAHSINKMSSWNQFVHKTIIVGDDKKSDTLLIKLMMGFPFRGLEKEHNSDGYKIIQLEPHGRQ